MSEATRFTQFDFDFSPLGYHKVYRIYFGVQVPDTAFRRFVLHEGSGHTGVSRKKSPCTAKSDSLRCFCLVDARQPAAIAVGP